MKFALLFCLVCLHLLPLVQSLSSESKDFIRSPAGYLHKSCVHQVPNGSSIYKKGEGYIVSFPNNDSILEIPPCNIRYENRTNNLFQEQKQPWRLFGPEDDGWSAYAITVNSGNTVVTGQFNTPDLPSTYNYQLVYVFLGLMDAGSHGVMMCTAQLGPATDGGGDYFMAVSWYIESTGTGFFNDPVQISPGQELAGSIQQINSEQWNIAAGPSSMQLHVGVPTMTQVVAVSEIFDSDSCADWTTGTTTFVDIAANGGVAMVPYDRSSCGLTVSASGNQVVINFP